MTTSYNKFPRPVPVPVKARIAWRRFRNESNPIIGILIAIPLGLAIWFVLIAVLVF